MKCLSKFNVAKTDWPAQSRDLHPKRDLWELDADYEPVCWPQVDLTNALMAE